MEKEDHYTVTDGDGTYLTHFTNQEKVFLIRKMKRFQKGLML